MYSRSGSFNLEKKKKKKAWSTSMQKVTIVSCWCHSTSINGKNGSMKCMRGRTNSTAHFFYQHSSFKEAYRTFLLEFLGIFSGIIVSKR